MKKFLVLVLLSVFILSADTATEEWEGAEWDTDWAATVGTNNCDVTGTFAYETSGCDGDAHCWLGYCEGRSDELFVHADWTGAWTDLGVTVGHTVSAVQMTDARTNCATYSTCLEATIGPFELRDGADALVSTLWSGRTATEPDGGYQTEGSQSAQGCGSVCPAASSIELWMHWTLDTGNGKNATCDFYLDNLDISIEHAAAAAGARRRILLTAVSFQRRGDALHPIVLGTWAAAGGRSSDDDRTGVADGGRQTGKHVDR